MDIMPSCEHLTDLPFEKRLALIETAVFCFSGVYPKETDTSVCKGAISYFYLNTKGELYLADCHNRPEVWRGRVCTKDEFNLVAQEVKDEYGFSNPKEDG